MSGDGRGGRPPRQAASSKRAASPVGRRAIAQLSDDEVAVSVRYWLVESPPYPGRARKTREAGCQMKRGAFDPFLCAHAPSLCTSHGSCTQRNGSNPSEFNGATIDFRVFAQAQWNTHAASHRFMELAFARLPVDVWVGVNHHRLNDLFGVVDGINLSMFLKKFDYFVGGEASAYGLFKTNKEFYGIDGRQSERHVGLLRRSRANGGEPAQPRRAVRADRRWAAANAC